MGTRSQPTHSCMLFFGPTERLNSEMHRSGGIGGIGALELSLQKLAGEKLGAKEIKVGSFFLLRPSFGCRLWVLVSKTLSGA